MIGHSLPEYIFIRISIWGLRLIAPLSIIHVALSWYQGFWLISPWIGYYALVEAAFFLLVYLPRSIHLQKVSSPSVAESLARLSTSFECTRDVASIRTQGRQDIWQICMLSPFIAGCESVWVAQRRWDRQSNLTPF